MSNHNERRYRGRRAAVSPRRDSQFWLALLLSSTLLACTPDGFDGRGGFLAKNDESTRNAVSGCQSKPARTRSLEESGDYGLWFSSQGREENDPDRFVLTFRGSCLAVVDHSPGGQDSGLIFRSKPYLFRLSDITIPNYDVKFRGTAFGRFATSKTLTLKILRESFERCSQPGPGVKISMGCQKEMRSWIAANTSVVDFQTEVGRTTINLVGNEVFWNEEKLL